MKKHHHVGSRRSGVESPRAAAPMFPRPQRPTFNPRLAFTLVELLTVIGIIAVLASLTFPILGSVKRHEYISKTQAELVQLETAIDSYKATYGFYPPDATNNPSYPLVNQLYYELLGTTNSNGAYQTLDNSARPIGVLLVPNAFGANVGGFINCSKPGTGEDVPAAKNFLSNLKPNQYGSITNTISGVSVGVTILLASAGGPDPTYRPLFNLTDINPWRYNSSSPMNNPGAYDLWVELKIGGKTNLICNWSKQVQINSPLP